MRTVNSCNELRNIIRSIKNAGQSVAFVPTMGNLHEGHLSLIDTAKHQADYVVASIFVNPMQFGANEDLDAYPRTLKEDTEALESRACNLLFAPRVEDVYPNGITEETRIEVPSLGRFHCGSSRPGHFIGVATIVAKLFNMVQPDVAIFGQKDYQQLAVIQKMVTDLCMPVTIVGVPTSREPTGLARSSRNGYLSENEKQVASKLYQVLSSCKLNLEEGNPDLNQLCSEALTELEAAGFHCDYFNIAHARTLEQASATDNELVILVAATLGSTRLIDNILISR
jgi:pantoate--beta-alanine ligase